jgi:hypothetical protein
VLAHLRVIVEPSPLSVPTINALTPVRACRRALPPLNTDLDNFMDMAASGLGFDPDTPFMRQALANLPGDVLT